MKKKFIGEDDLVLNTCGRIPVCLCIDTSASMYRAANDENLVFTGEYEFIDGKYWDICEEGNSLLSEMVKGVNRFYDAIRGDALAKASCEVAVVTFDDDARIISDFAPITNKTEFKTPDDGELTSMGSGINLALDILEERKEVYNKNGVEYYQPWLVLFTDGSPTDDIEKARERLIKLQKDKKLSVFCLAIDEDADFAVLSSLSLRKPITLKTDRFSEFFEWLGKSVSAVSQSAVGDTVKLDTTSMTNWADL